MLYKVKVEFINGKTKEYNDIILIKDNVDVVSMFSTETIYGDISKKQINLIKNNILFFESEVVDITEEDKKFCDKNLEMIKNQQIENEKFMKICQQDNERFLRQTNKKDINYIK